MTDAPLAVYLHTPFCPSKCGYCDFNSFAMSGDIMRRTTDATLREIERGSALGRPAKTLFIGGGTPTFLPVDQLIALLNGLRTAHPPLDDCEITSESNPGTADAEKYAAMRAAGFNRISLGAQSFLDSDLLRLGRVHQSGEIERAVWLARAAGFQNLNLDLMFALPGQNVRAWHANLDRALALEPDHLSLYCLTIEPNTAYYKLHLRGQLDLPDDDAQVEMYEACVERLAAEGYRQYEISNFARPGFECRHNLAYWNSEEYAAYGPGAVGRLGSERRTNLKHPELYCAAVEESRDLAMERDELTPESLRFEQLMLGLRLTDGFDASGLDLDPAAVARLAARGWIEHDAPRLRLTPSGRHFCSEVAVELG